MKIQNKRYFQTKTETVQFVYHIKVLSLFKSGGEAKCNQYFDMNKMSKIRC